MNHSMLTSVELDDVEIDFLWESSDPSVGVMHDNLEVELVTIPGPKESDPRIDITHMISDDYKSSLCDEYREYRSSLQEAADDDRYRAQKESRAEEGW